MSGISKFKGIYSEGVATEHPDIAGQKEFASKADEILAKRKRNREKSEKNDTLDAIGRKLYTMNKIKEKVEVNEKIDVGADVSKTISDFVHSKSKTFKGDSKKQRIKRALGAYYAAQKEETENIYNYVIETLVDAEYAADYESAEIMFEHISTEFTAVLLEQYLEEAKRSRAERRAANAGKKGYDAKGNPTTKTGPVRAYDVDETLFGHGKKGKPNVQVHVKDASGKRVKSLSNQEFNTHKLEPGHSFDFSEFKSAEKFKETSSPNKKVIKKLKKQIKNRKNVHLITARSKFDNPHEFHAHLQRHGIDVPMKNIHYTGGMKGGDIGKKKVDVASAVAKQSGTKTMHMYDDAAKVHKAFEKEKQNAPTTKKIKTHMVAPDSTGEPRVRSYQATKGGSTGGSPKTIQQNQRAAKRAKRGMGEEMSSYEYWKQFID